MLGKERRQRSRPPRWWGQPHEELGAAVFLRRPRLQPGVIGQFISGIQLVYVSSFFGGLRGGVKDETLAPKKWTWSVIRGIAKGLRLLSHRQGEHRLPRMS